MVTLMRDVTFMGDRGHTSIMNDQPDLLHWRIQHVSV